MPLGNKKKAIRVEKCWKDTRQKKERYKGKKKEYNSRRKNIQEETRQCTEIYKGGRK